MALLSTGCPTVSESFRGRGVSASILIFTFVLAQSCGWCSMSEEMAVLWFLGGFRGFSVLLAVISAILARSRGLCSYAASCLFSGYPTLRSARAISLHLACETSI
jgi:hypothetical protein